MITEKVLISDDKEERIFILGTATEVIKIVLSKGHFQIFKVNLNPKPVEKKGFWNKKEKALDNDLTNLEKSDELHNSNFWEL